METESQEGLKSIFLIRNESFHKLHRDRERETSVDYQKKQNFYLNEGKNEVNLIPLY